MREGGSEQLFETLDLTVAAIASLFCLYTVAEIGGAYPWGVWIVTSVVAFVLLPQKSPAVFYGLFAGVYPILKRLYDRMARPIALVCKLVTFHVSLALIAWILWLFNPALFENEEIRWLPIALYFGFLLCFFLYDFALTRLIRFYFARLRGRLRFK